MKSKVFIVKEEFHKYLSDDHLKIKIATIDVWYDMGFKENFLEESPEKVKLVTEGGYLSDHILMEEGGYITELERELCESTLNGDVITANDMDCFFEYIVPERLSSSKDVNEFLEMLYDWIEDGKKRNE